MGTTFAGKIPTLDIRIRGAGSPLVAIVGGLAAFIALSALVRDGECPQSRYRSSLIHQYIAKRLLDGRPDSGPAFCKVSNLISPC